MAEKKKRRIFRAIIIILLVIVGLSGACFGALVWINQPGAMIREAEKSFNIMKGESARSVADRLGGEKAIRSSLFMRVLTRIFKTESLFKAGAYVIPAGSTSLAIHDLFVAGTLSIVKVTIPEGYTVSRITALLKESGLKQADDFKTICADNGFLESFAISGKSAEGFLFPDTYFFSDAMTAADMASAMINNFYTRLAVIYPDFEKLSQKELYDKIILASIVEREYRVAAEAPAIASVFYNRLNINMGLGSCATIEYIITEIQEKPHPEILRKEDLEIRSNYNTYLWAGLPPGPISNPGAVALKAAFYPDKTDYMYFLLKNPSSGEHIFSKGIDEHNTAKYLYLKNKP